MRVFTASLATETNTFGPIPTGLPAFMDRGYFPAGQHPPSLNFFAAPLWVLRELAPQHGWTVVEGLVAGAQPSGTTTRAAYERLRDELLADLDAALAAGPLDAVVLGLHGAMVADGCDDCEGELLGRIRAKVGPDVVVGAELDLHAHLSPAMVASADLLVAFKEYPHTDIVARARELVALCAQAVQRRIRPVAAVADCGAMLTLHTSREPARGLVDRLQALEGRDGVLSVSLLHGFPYGDVPDFGTRVLVYTDGDASKAQALALRVAEELIGLRDQFEAAYPDVDAALDQAMALYQGQLCPPAPQADQGHQGHQGHRGQHAQQAKQAPPAPVVLADRADNPGSGAPGDSTFILRRLVARGLVPSALGPLWDPAAVRVAFEAGVGARLWLRLGGKTGPSSGDPLDAWATVKALQPDMAMTGLAGAPMAVGDAALVEIAPQGPPADAVVAPGRQGQGAPRDPAAPGVQVVLISLRNQAMGTDLFTQLGCDLAAQQLVVVKSAQHFHAAFAPLACGVVYVGAPGAASPNLHSLPYRRIPRPMWPLDPGVPRARLLPV